MPGYLSQNVLIDISIQLFTQLNSTQLLLVLLSHAGTPLNAGVYLPIVRINIGSLLNAGGTHADEYAQWHSPHYTKTKTNPDHNRYRRRCPNPNMIQKFIHYMATTPQLQKLSASGSDLPLRTNFLLEIDRRSTDEEFFASGRSVM